MIEPVYHESGYSPKKKPATGLAPITKEEWDQLNGKQKWDSIVALRGPDLRDSSTAKFYTSSVVRYRLSGVMRVGGMVNDRLGFVVLPEGSLTLGKDQLIDLSHFLQHVEEAAHWLGIPVCHVSPAFWKATFLGSKNYLNAAIALYPKAPKAFQASIAAFLDIQGIDLEKLPKEAECQE